MLNPEKREEAIKELGFNPWEDGYYNEPYNETFCAARIKDGSILRQCQKVPGSGPKGLLCFQHANKLRIKNKPKRMKKNWRTKK